MSERTEWIQTAERKPADGAKVDTFSEGGQQQELVYKNNLWWFPDMSMYVYYVPKFWRPL